MSNKSRYGSIVFNGVLYSVTAASELIGVTPSFLYQCCKKNKCTMQEAFDELSAKDRRAQWTEHDDLLLRDNYPVLGVEIPELRSKFSESAIRNRAYRLDLSIVKTGSIQIDGRCLLIKEALSLLGVSSETLRNAKKQFGLNTQQCFDRFLKMFRKRPDGTYEKLAMRLLDPEDSYIHAEGHWWSPTMYARSHPGFDLKVFQRMCYRQGKSVQELFDDLCDGVLPEIKSNPAGSFSSSSSNDIATACYMYCGIDDKQYYCVVCNVCNSVIIIPDDIAPTYAHGRLCEVLRIPDSLFLPRQMRARLSGYRCKRSEEPAG